MNAIIDLNRLLAEADALYTAAERSNVVPTELEQRYLIWYQACGALLPDDLRTPFVSLYEPGPPNKPMISDIFRTVNTAVPPPNGADAPHAASLPWLYQRVWFQAILIEQRDFVFFARRRLWTGSSVLPQGMRTGLATSCKQTFQLLGINKLFLRSGCEPHWHIPPFEPDPANSERMNAALGWFDGILVYAPDREIAITESVCAMILMKPRLSATTRRDVESWLAQLQRPAPPLPNPLDRYDVHPTVRRVAGPLVASQHFNQAVLNVCIALNEAVQVATGRTDLDGSGLMQQAFAPRAPMLQCSLHTTEQQGWMFLFTGVMMAVRNPRAHHLLDDLSEPEAMEWLLFISALFRKLDTIT